jgi:hypothetical protein
MNAIVFSSWVLSVGTQDLHAHGGEHAEKDSMAVALLLRPEFYPFGIFMVTPVGMSRHNSEVLNGDTSGIAPDRKSPPMIPSPLTQIELSILSSRLTLPFLNLQHVQLISFHDVRLIQRY